MAVSKKIIELTKLALVDRVLTYKEREVIVKNAIAEGVSEAEINAFLDNMLTQRLKSFSKEELKSCPSCGSQIPLIADQCQFCGKILSNSGVNSLNSGVLDGKDADIIRSENLKTELEEQNIDNCPDCGAPFPLISNICSHCGHVLHARQDSDFNIKNLIDNITASIKNISNAPKPTFLDLLKFHKGTLMLFIGIVLFVSAFSYPGATGGCILVIALPLGFFGVKWKMNFDSSKVKVYKSESEVKFDDKDFEIEASPVAIADEVYYTALNDYNKYVRLTKAVYGDNPEARKFIAQLGGEIQKADSKRRSNRLKLAVFVAIIAVIVLLPLFIRPSVQTYFSDVLQSNYTIFKTSESNE
ncbi:MAG: zinc ribbon domain-containing protein [Bacteroidales bacterium]|nr:zinc ribbon domain-containing protein [Bacteroidales bacterium]